MNKYIDKNEHIESQFMTSFIPIRPIETSNLLTDLSTRYNFKAVSLCNQCQQLNCEC